MSAPASWPFAEAEKVKPSGGPAVFESGFGPSGLPHIGTFAEVVRTLYVIHAYRRLTGGEAVLYAFCDDMDGLRRVPKNLPRPELLAEHLGRPLSAIPDPFGCCPSYSGHMEQKLQAMLDTYRLPYVLKSSTHEYRSGAFNAGLRLILQKVEAVRAVILPTLGEENREGWSPFFPVCAQCGRVYTTRVTAYHPERDALSYVCDGAFGEPQPVQGCGHQAETSVLDGKVKVGWKVDWALRWFSYQVAYEMYGKDLIDSAKLSAKIVRLLGGQPPQGMSYEMFLNEDGKKISKSVGEGIAVEAWLRYAPVESMLYYLFPNPKKQRRLYFDVIPKSVDDYLAELAAYPALEDSKQPDSAIWHIREIVGSQAYTGAVNYSLVLNLIESVGADDAQLLRDYLLRYDPQAAANPGVIDGLIERGLNYFRDFIEPNKNYRQPTDAERGHLQKLRDRLAAYAGDQPDEMQSLVFEVAREAELPPADFFKLFYQVLLGQDRGPRFGTLAKLVGKERVIGMIDAKLR